MPTSGHTDEEVEEMYEKIDELIDSETKSKDYTIVMGDFSAVVGEGKEGKYVGHYGLGCRILSHGILSPWHFVLWHYVRVA